MVNAHQRSRFRHAVTLNYSEAHPPPKDLNFWVERRPAGYECHKFPAELAVNFPEAPPAPEETQVFGGLQPAPEIIQTPCDFKIALDLFLERLKQAGHGHQHRHSLIFNGAHDFRRV